MGRNVSSGYYLGWGERIKILRWLSEGHEAQKERHMAVSISPLGKTAYAFAFLPFLVHGSHCLSHHTLPALPDFTLKIFISEETIRFRWESIQKRKPEWEEREAKGKKWRSPGFLTRSAGGNVGSRVSRLSVNQATCHLDKAPFLSLQHWGENRIYCMGMLSGFNELRHVKEFGTQKGLHGGQMSALSLSPSLWCLFHPL